jgi:hypothetical protein
MEILFPFLLLNSLGFKPQAIEKYMKFCEKFFFHLMKVHSSYSIAWGLNPRLLRNTFELDFL